MRPLRLNEMRSALADGRIGLTKSLGQNFLHDANQLARIVRAAELKPAERVLEIGPGLGPLTALLLGAGAQVLAIEKDSRLVDFLARHFAGAPGLTLRCDDALAFLQREERDWSEWKLVANLPYSTASPMLVELAQATGRPARLVATLQLEVARRIAARPGQDDYGLLSLLLQLRYEPRDWFKIPAACFFPAPEVDSACVTLVRRERALLAVAQEPLFDRLVKQAFSQRRKMMLKLLRELWPPAELERAFSRAALSPGARAEESSLEQFAALAESLHDPEGR